MMSVPRCESIRLFISVMGISYSFADMGKEQSIS